MGSGDPVHFHIVELAQVRPGIFEACFAHLHRFISYTDVAVC